MKSRSQTLEQRLAERIVELRAAVWLEENRAALEAYNAHVERDGVFSDGLRRFC
jgi:antitoxin CcdA